LLVFLLAAAMAPNARAELRLNRVESAAPPAVHGEPQVELDCAASSLKLEPCATISRNLWDWVNRRAYCLDRAYSAAARRQRTARTAPTRRALAGRDIVVMGALAGGIEAISKVIRGVPPDLGAAVFVVVHTAPQSPGYLPQILSVRGPLPAKHAQDGEAFVNGRIYVAPPDRHLILEAGGRTRTTKGPRENRTRPAIDPLFRRRPWPSGAA
jgi:chemotaxis response regulator CheB